MMVTDLLYLLVICRIFCCFKFLKRRYIGIKENNSKKNTISRRSVLYESKGRKLEYAKPGGKTITINCHQQSNKEAENEYIVSGLDYARSKYVYIWFLQ